MWARPYEGLTEEQIEEKYAAEEFPSLDGNLARDIIKKCWNEEYESAEEVANALTHLLTNYQLSRKMVKLH